MASILSSQPTFMMIEESSQSEIPYTDEAVSLWIKEKDVIRASTNLSILHTLEPGIYRVDYNREDGHYCMKINSISDELTVFSDSITSSIINEINDFWEKKDIYEQNKLVHKRGILLQGFPGTGKTSIISLVCKDLIKKGGVVFKISGIRNLSVYIDFILYGFRKIQPDTPLITIIEDIDNYGDAEDDILDFLDGKTNINHHIVIATTNNSEEIPDSFLRPSRIDLVIEIPLPCEETRREYFKFKNVPDKDIERLVTQSKNFSLADLKEFYILIYVLNYSEEDAFKKITSPREKKNYSNFPNRKSPIAI